eukprot:8351142-Ditylum_brightwellii.AAC.1
MIEIDPGCNIRGNTEQIKEKARQMGLTLMKVEDKRQEGWVRKPKGTKQIAFERGFIDIENLKFYSKEGPKDDNDFVEEETLLQHMTKKIGAKLGMDVVVDRSPKCHPEIAGEGIQYTWANSKMFLRGVPLEKRRNKGQFHEA